MPFVVAVCGFKKAGKTTLCLELLRRLNKKRFDVAYVKHTHERVCSSPTTDTGKAAELGLDVAFWGIDGFCFESRLLSSKDASTLVAQLFPEKDLVLIEGGKDLPLPKIWVCGEGEKAPPIGQGGVFAVYDRGSLLEKEKGHFGSGMEDELASFLEERALKESQRALVVYIGKQRLPMKDFVEQFLRGSIEGMLRSLKGGENLEAGFRIYAKPLLEKSKGITEGSE